MSNPGFNIKQGEEEESKQAASEGEGRRGSSRQTESKKTKPGGEVEQVESRPKEATITSEARSRDPTKSSSQQNQSSPQKASISNNIDVTPSTRRHDSQDSGGTLVLNTTTSSQEASQLDLIQSGELVDITGTALLESLSSDEENELVIDLPPQEQQKATSSTSSSPQKQPQQSGSKRKPPSAADSKQSPSSKSSKQSPQKAEQQPGPAPSSLIPPPLQEPSSNQQVKINTWIKEGEQVLARWDGLTYIALIKKVNLDKRACWVIFEDGSTDWVSLKNLHKQLSEDEMEDDLKCTLCMDGTSHDDNQIVICDVCNNGYHQTCHFPVIEDSILEPDAAWVCRVCIFTLASAKGGADKTGKNADLLRDLKKAGLPYDLHSLDWDLEHRRNSVETYCYCATTGKFNEKMLQCNTCRMWFHEACLQCLPHPLLYADHYYQFTCAIHGGEEKLHRIIMKWPDMICIVLTNLIFTYRRRWFSLESSIIPYIQKNGNMLKLSESIASLPTKELTNRVKKMLESDKVRFARSQREPTSWTLNVPYPIVTPFIFAPPGSITGRVGLPMSNVVDSLAMSQTNSDVDMELPSPRLTALKSPPKRSSLPLVKAGTKRPASSPGAAQEEVPKAKKSNTGPARAGSRSADVIATTASRQSTSKGRIVKPTRHNYSSSSTTSSTTSESISELSSRAKKLAEDKGKKTKPGAGPPSNKSSSHLSMKVHPDMDPDEFSKKRARRLKATKARAPSISGSETSERSRGPQASVLDGHQIDELIPIDETANPFLDEIMEERAAAKAAAVAAAVTTALTEKTPQDKMDTNGNGSTQSSSSTVPLNATSAQSAEQGNLPKLTITPPVNSRIEQIALSIAQKRINEKPPDGVDPVPGSAASRSSTRDTTPDSSSNNSQSTNSMAHKATKERQGGPPNRPNKESSNPERVEPIEEVEATLVRLEGVPAEEEIAAAEIPPSMSLLPSSHHQSSGRQQPASNNNNSAPRPPARKPLSFQT